MKKIKVLLVDDDRSWAEAFKEWFENTDQYDIEIVEFGLEALDRTTEIAPDVLLLDWQLKKDAGYGYPGDGMALAHKIRFHKDEHDTLKFDRMPIILITALLNQEEVCTYEETNKNNGIFAVRKSIGNVNILAKISNVLYRNGVALEQQ
jgi:CheY-like chemotaxis protein